ncbi:MAG: T9SS type A sorting domain-containing protein [Candidatus Kapaibacterium sp.]
MLKYILVLLAIYSINLFSQEIIITTHPVSLSQCVGESASIFVNAESKSGGKLFYQWFKDGDKLFEEELPVLKFQSLNHNHSGLYFCRVSLEDGSESVDSRSASVYALRPTSISSEPEDVKSSTYDGNAFLNFEAHINGISIEEAIQKGEYVKIQWFRVNDNIHIPLENDNIYSGTKTNRLSINLNTLPDTTKFFATIEGKCGTVSTSTAIVIKNLIEFELNLSIEDLDACDGMNHSLKANINNPKNHKLEYKWYKDGKLIYFKQNLKGIYTDELVFNPISVEDSGRYKIEAKIKGTTYSVFSNEVKLNVGREPELVCFRADTLRFNTDQLDKEQKRNVVSGWTKDVRLVLFYINNAIPVQFDIYKDNLKISTLNSDETVWHLGDIYYLNFDVERDDNAKYWVIAHNECGVVYSDTVSVKTENLCDPYNQKQHLCETDTMYFQIDYINKKDNIKLDYFWLYFFKESNGAGYLKAPLYLHKDSTVIYNYNYTLISNMYEIVKGSSLIILWRDQISTSQKGLMIRNQDSAKGWEAIFCCYDVYLDLMPMLRREPENRTVYNGDKDTIFNISFINDDPYKMDVYFTIYYMKTLDSEPKEVYTGVPDYGLYYYYVKDIDFSDDGYYFALSRHDNNCNPVSTDTIKVTVIPKGIVAGVNENELNPGLIVTPNPASEFITIQFNNKGLQPFAESDKVQIFDILGIEIKDLTPALSINGEGVRIDVSGLPAGVYFVKIGGMVEKFVKM